MLNLTQSDVRLVGKDDSFLEKVWKEVEPIARTAITGLAAEAGVLQYGLLTVLLAKFLPKQESYFFIVERIEVWLTVVLLCLFGAYTLAAVGIRLTREIHGEVRGLVREMRAARASDAEQFRDRLEQRPERLPQTRNAAEEINMPVDSLVPGPPDEDPVAVSGGEMLKDAVRQEHHDQIHPT